MYVEIEHTAHDDIHEFTKPSNHDVHEYIEHTSLQKPQNLPNHMHER